MVDEGRRHFLQFGAGAAALGALPASISRALALPAQRRSGTIEDVEHIVVFMQENRSFDHYFGHLRGVRGYNDRFPVLRADGRPVWHQPREADPAQTVLPFHLKTQLTSAQCVLDLDHSWYRTHAAIAAGRNDQWPPHKTDMTMEEAMKAGEKFPVRAAAAKALKLIRDKWAKDKGSSVQTRFTGEASDAVKKEIKEKQTPLAALDDDLPDSFEPWDPPPAGTDPLHEGP